jgi:hypothetical protein
MSAISPGSDPQSAPPPVLEYDRPQSASASAVIWCRILALWMLGWGLYYTTSTVGNLVAYLFRPGQLTAGEVGIYATIFLLPDVIWLLMAWYLWTKSPKLADRIVHDIARERQPRREMSPDELLGVLLIGMGVYLLAEGLPNIARIVFDVLVQNAANAQARSLADYVHEQSFFTAIFRCGLGLWFILGVRGVVSLLRRLSAERPAPESGGIDGPAPRP